MAINFNPDVEGIVDPEIGSNEKLWADTRRLSKYNATRNDFMTDDGVVISYLNDLSQVVSGIETLSIDETITRNGLQVIRFQEPTTAGTSNLVFSCDFNPVENEHFDLDVYVRDITAISQVRIAFYNDSALLKEYVTVIASTNFTHNGWNRIRVITAEFANYGSGATYVSNFIRFKIRFVSASAKKIDASISTLVMNRKQRPRVIISTDDGFATDNTIWYAYAKEKGIKGTVYVVPTLVGTAGYASQAQLTELYNAGWDVCLHNYTHTDYTLMTQSARLTALADGKKWLVDRNFTRGALHLSYPYGGYNDAVIADVIASGFKTARTVEPLYTLDATELYQIRAKQLGPTTTIDDVKGYVRNAFIRNAPIEIFGHEIVASGATGYQVNQPVWEALIDEVLKYPGLHCTKSEWFNYLSNPASSRI